MPSFGPVVLGADPFDQPGKPQDISLLLHWGKTEAGTKAVRSDLRSDLLFEGQR